MNGFAEDIFGFNLNIMRLLGFYPPLKYKGLYKIFANIVYCLSTIVITALTSIHLLIEENVDVGKISDNSFMIIQVGCLIFKLLPFIYNEDGIRKSIDMLGNSIFAVFSEKQKIFMESCKKICQQITWLFFGFCVFSFTLFALIPLLGHGRNFPIEIWLPFDAKLQLLTYVVSYILLTTVVFSQFTASILVICLSCWQLSLVEPFTFKFFFMISFLVTMLFEIFLYCFFGTMLYEESNSVTTAIYMSNWYEYDMKSKKALLILMERSQKPVIVTAGKILDLSLVTFTT
ncbi:7tm 6 domain containing protein, partial [Asbolus verrucosus]